MKLLRKLRNKCFATVLSLLMLVLAGFGILKLNTPAQVQAVGFGDSESTLTITNGSFSSYSSSVEYPYTLSDFSNLGNSTPSMKTGAIKVDEKTYNKNYIKYGFTDEYGLRESGNPSQVGTDNSILMINTKENSNYAYISNEFTLSANGTYYISVSAKTIGANCLASVYLLKDGNVYQNCVIENIQTNNWTDYTFFVSTNSYEDVKLQFGMQIGNLTSGANGCVLFDELHAGKISSDSMATYIKSTSSTHYRVASSEIDNGYKKYDFDNNLVVYEKDASGNFVPNNYSKNYFTVKEGGENREYSINDGILTMTANKSYVNFEGEEETFAPNTTYRFSIKAKTTSAISTGSAYVKLNEILDEKDRYEDFKDSNSSTITAKEGSLTISSVTTNKVEDGFVEYVVFIHTGEDLPTKVKFSFGLGTESSTATGTISFKNFKIERIPYSAYSSATSGNTVAKIDIADRISIDSDKFFSNGTFDKMQSNSIDGIPYPATPSEWTISKEDEGSQLSGVVNLSQLNLVSEKYSDVLNGGISAISSCTSTMNNNVLMIYNGTKDAKHYTSSTKTLSANKYYRIRVNVYTHLWNTSSSATVVLKSGNAVLGKVENINTNDSWKQVEFYVNTATTSTEVKLELALGYGENLSNGYVFFDNIEIASSDSAYTYENSYAKEINLNNYLLDSGVFKNGYNQPALFNGENLGSNNVNAGIIDLTDDLALKNITSDADMLTALKDGDRKSALIISSTLAKDVYYKYTSSVAYNFESGSYYRFSFYLFTNNLAQEEKEQNTENGKLTQGANIKLTGLENATFSYEQSNGKWTKYEFYIGLNSTVASNLEYSLGSEFTGCSGIVLLTDVKMDKIEKTDFDNASASATCLKIDTVESSNEEDDEESSSNKNNFSWAYIPTIATFLAVVVAVVGIFVKKNVKFKKRVKNGRVAYDRDETVLKNKFRRIAIDKRDAELREMSKECEELTSLRAEYEEKYKQALNRLRSTKLANRDGSKKHEVFAIEREVKHISKEVARLGVQVNNYENEIEFMKTEAYLVDLEKRLSREDNFVRNRDKKESLLSEEERSLRIAKREEKLIKAKQKAEEKAQKLADKKAKIEQEKIDIQNAIAQAIEKDEQALKEQELKRLKEEELKLAKEQAKARKEIEELENAQEEIKQEKLENETEINEMENELAQISTQENVIEEQENQTQTVEEIAEQKLEDKQDDLNNSNNEQNSNSVQDPTEQVDNKSNEKEDV